MRRRCLVVLVLGVLAGCQDGKPKGDLPALHPAHGKVVRGGQPVSGGSVRFQLEPDNPDVLVTSEVKADGSFELQTVHALSGKQGKGAPAGTYRVTYQPPLTENQSAPPVDVPQTQTVREGSNDLLVELGKR
jgi:hypothetical protein